jgi:5-methylcytosine-specific restriction endonuclease McrA
MPWKSSNRDPAYGKAAWRRARLACLQAANWRCQIRGPGCIGAASTVDHIHGLASDPQHRFLQAACRVCHAAKTHRESGEARRGSGGAADPPHQPRTKW